MKAYMIERTKKLEPLGDHPGDCLIANRKLSKIQKQDLQTLGLELRIIPDAAQIGVLSEGHSSLARSKLPRASPVSEQYFD